MSVCGWGGWSKQGAGRLAGQAGRLCKSRAVSLRRPGAALAASEHPVNHKPDDGRTCLFRTVERRSSGWRAIQPLQTPALIQKRALTPGRGAGAGSSHFEWCRRAQSSSTSPSVIPAQGVARRWMQHGQVEVPGHEDHQRPACPSRAPSRCRRSGMSCRARRTRAGTSWSRGIVSINPPIRAALSFWPCVEAALRRCRTAAYPRDQARSSASACRRGRSGRGRARCGRASGGCRAA